MERRATEPDRRRLVVVSNRVPLPTSSGVSRAGGLAVALEAALKQHGGVWFGWSGKTREGEQDIGDLDVRTRGNITFAVTDLNEKDFGSFYAGFSNRALWPVCHYRLDLIQIDNEDTSGYFRVNEIFARKLAPLLRPDDLIWIHDYHLIPLAAALRALGVGNRIGFFLHIPWPPPDVASALPAYLRLLESFAAYDLIGFQTPLDAENFARCMLHDGLAERCAEDEFAARGRRFTLGAFPIGIDTRGFVKTAAQAKHNAVVARMKASMIDKELIIGVDRLDYSKGITLRMEAFACFLRTHAEAQGRVTFLQITPKSRSQVQEYQDMQHEIAQQAGSVNGAFGDVDWTPIRYVNRSIAHGALAGLYRMAQVGLVTPLRDGMNLVAKEFVAAQPDDDPGVLILSRFAGARHELDCALLVNPYDTEATGAAIARALAMPLAERKERWRVMMDRLSCNGVEEWCDNFLASLAEG